MSAETGPRQKKQLGVRIDNSVYEAFRNHVEEKYGTVHGTMGDELEQAIREHLGLSEGAMDDEELQERLSDIEQTLQTLQQSSST